MCYLSSAEVWPTDIGFRSTRAELHRPACNGVALPGFGQSRLSFSFLFPAGFGHAFHAKNFHLGSYSPEVWGRGGPAVKSPVGSLASIQVKIRGYHPSSLLSFHSPSPPLPFLSEYSYTKLSFFNPEINSRPILHYDQCFFVTVRAGTAYRKI